jgi:hypothetical protein
MQHTQQSSDPAPHRRVAARLSYGVRRLVFEAARRAEAMGLLDAEGSLGDEASALKQLAARVRRAGIAAAAAERLNGVDLNNVEAPDAAEIAPLLEMIIAALEASPVPKFEWAGLGRVFGPEELAPLINVSVSSLKRYVSGERDTPDAVAARLHFLALVVGDLSGSYNDIGVRRWFQRKRTRLDGGAPVALLKGNWDPDDDAPKRVRQLASELVSFSAT